MQIRASIIENPNFVNNFFVMNSKVTKIASTPMVQDHNEHIYRVLSLIFNFHICKLGRPLPKNQFLGIYLRV